MLSGIYKSYIVSLQHVNPRNEHVAIKHKSKFKTVLKIVTHASDILFQL